MFKTEIQQGPDQVKRVCPVYLFIRWKPGTRKYGDETSTYPGDKYVKNKDDLGEMIIKLLQLLEKQIPGVALALIYDNRIPKYDPERDLLKINNGVIERNELQRFTAIMKGYPLPKFLK